VRIREVLEKRRRLLVAVDLAAFVVLMLGSGLSLILGVRWMTYVCAAVFLAAIPVNWYWLSCPRCGRSIGFARERPRKASRPFEMGELCPHCGVSLEEPWDTAS
jgi:hypothetical protein